ncbi:MAG TPA: hypothetical protein VFL14_00115 [Xanthomonadales bacterium]|nr:hypothetical protein [Xanthomonadales bacterium]
MMSHQFLGPDHLVPITPAHDVALGNYGPGALDRLRAFGLADRRESAVAVALAGAVPLAGLLLLGWSPASTVLALLLNVLIGLHQDLWTIFRAHGRLAVMEQLSNQDAFVWHVARARSRRERSMAAPLDIDASDRLDAPNEPRDVHAFAALATIAVVLPAWMVWRDEALDAEATAIALGTLPNLMLCAFAAFLQSTVQNVHWRDAASVRLDSVARNAKIAFGVGLAALQLFVVPAQTFVPLALAAAGCIAVGATGLGALVGTWRLEQLATWLDEWLQARTRRAAAAAHPIRR